MDAVPTTPPASSNDEEGSLGPREAAHLLELTERRATRELARETPLLSVAYALVMLAVYGSIWLSVRGQHPYRGPTLGVVGVVYLLVAATILLSVSIYVRATHGVTGRTRHVERITAIPTAVAIIAVYVFDGALRYDGFDNSVVYGVVDAAAPWLVVGALMAGIAVAREDRWRLAGWTTVMAVGAGSAFAGPAGVWGILALAGCLLFLCQALVRLRTSRQA